MPLPPVSPITPQRKLAEQIEVYEQDNFFSSSSSVSLEQDLEQAGKLGLHLIEELRSKNQLIEELSTRLRHIYSSSNNTPELFSSAGGGSSVSLLSSIQGFGSAGTVSPLPQPVMDEVMERAERELARLGELAHSQETEIVRLQEELCSERDKFKEDRIKLKKEIMELQIVVRRGMSAPAPQQAQIKCYSQSTQSEATNEFDQLQKLTSEILELRSAAHTSRISTAGLEKDLATERAERRRLESLVERKTQKKTSAVNTDDDPRRVSCGCQTDRVAVKQSVCEVDFGDRQTVRQLKVDLRDARSKPETADVACTAGIAMTDSRGIMTEEDSRIGIYENKISHLLDLNRKADSQFRELADEYSALLARQHEAVSVSTDMSKHITASEHVQVDDARDEQLFIVAADLRIVSEERDSLLQDREELVGEIELVVDERDKAIDHINKLCQVIDERDARITLLTTRAATKDSSMMTEKPVAASLSTVSQVLQELGRPATALVCSKSEAVFVEKTVANLQVSRSEITVELQRIADPIILEIRKVEPAIVLVPPQVCLEVTQSDKAIVNFSRAQLGVVVNESLIFEPLAARCISVQAEDRSPERRVAELADQLDRTLRERDGLVKNRPVLVDAEVVTDEPAKSSFVSPVPIDVSPKAVENSCIATLQRKLVMSEKLLREQNDFYKQELERLEDEMEIMRSKHQESVGTNTDHPRSPFVASKAAIANGSPRHSQSALDRGAKSKLVEYYDLGESGLSDLSEIPKISAGIPVSLLTTTSYSPPEFNYSLSSVHQQTLSSISPLRIPFATPEHRATDMDGDVVMKTVPRTQIRRDFDVHLDASPILPGGLLAHGSPLEPVAENTCDNTNVLNRSIREKLHKIGDKVRAAHALTDKIIALTTIT